MSPYEMPKPGPELAFLQGMAGSWVGEETLHPSPWDPKGGKAKGLLTSRMDLGGWFLVSDYAQERDGKVGFRGHGVYGYDPKSKRYTMYWFDSMTTGGHTTPVLGTLEGSRLTFQGQGDDGHGRYVYEVVGPDRVDFRMENSRDGRSWAVLLETRFQRT